MSISVTWDNEQHTIIRYDLATGWTWQDLMQAFMDDDALFDSVDHVVHLVFRPVGETILPSNPVPYLGTLASMIKRSSVGLVVLVTTDRWAQKVGEIFYNVYGKTAPGIAGVMMAATLDEARAIIAAYESSE